VREDWERELNGGEVKIGRCGVGESGWKWMDGSAGREEEL
jgi:hypothetical protein